MANSAANQDPEAHQQEILAKIARNRQMAEKLAAMKAERANASSNRSSSNANTSVSPETAGRLGQKMKKNKGAKGYFNAKKAVILGLVATIAVTTAGNVFSVNSSSDKRQSSGKTLSTEAFAEDGAANTPNKANPSDVGDGIDEFADRFEASGQISVDYESIAGHSTYHGQFASEDGTTYNSEKNSNVSFGEALKSGVSEAEMKEDFTERMAQPAQLAATYTYMHQKTTDPNFGVDNIDYDNPNDLIDVMESNPDLHQEVYDYVVDVINDNELSESTVTGSFNNYFMDSEFDTGDVDTSHMEVVGCTTEEDGTKVYLINYNWADAEGNIHTDTFTFKEKCGGQPLDQIEFTSGVRQISDPEPDSAGNESTGKEDTGKEDTGKEDTGKEDTGKEDTGKEDTGSEDTGSENTGDEDTGSESTGNEDTGSEGTGSEDTGSEGTGSEGTGSEDTGSEGTGNEGTGDEGTGTESTGTEGTGVEDTGVEGTGDEGTGTETSLEEKNEAAEIENAGDHVTQLDLDENTTPATTIEQDQANFDAIEQQRQEDAAAAAEAAKKAEEQAAAEQQAAIEAEQRRQQEQAAAEQQAAAEAEQRRQQEEAAAEAAKKAEEQAAAEQQAAAAAEAQRQAEQAAREQAQREADERAAAEQAAAEAQADNTQEQRAADFENGNF